MERILIFEVDKVKISLKGYSFIDEWGHCMLIVYGESKRDLMIKMLL